RFIPDPFAEHPGERLYKTGDRARYGPDGVIELLGRLDDQVKIRGHRVEPGEAAAALARYPDVAEVAVVPRAAADGEKELVAYVVPRPGREMQPAGLRDFLHQQLPDHLIPARWVSLDALPLNPNG